MKIKLYAFISLALGLGGLLSSCSDNIDTEKCTVNKNDLKDAFSSNGISVKLKSNIVSQLDGRKRILTVPTGSNELDDMMRQMGVSHISRIFPWAGKDEAKQQAARLNCWYTFVAGTVGTTTRAVNTNNLDKIADYAEPVYTPKIERSVFTTVNERATRATASSPWNDPLYPRQWDLHNNGTIGNYTDSLGNKVTSSIAGADINIEPAWKQTTGDPDVVVAVVDGGVDTAHPDLQGSFWINSGEIPGNGIDDDNNGYVDDYYGYNFVDDTGVIAPTRHGTHVAGTIAARSNNGHGVSGIAGGNGSSNSGVRIMSCQIFKNNPNYDPNDPNSSETIGTGNRNLDAAAIVYAANNGAVIASNSWGFGTDYTATPQVIKDAIDYFNKNAGGNHTHRPIMQGGLVIFASGNDGVSRNTFPASDDNVVSVAAFNPDFTSSWYTNYGETVDISAPGGSQPEGTKYPREGGLPTSAILSTVPRQADGSGGYAYMQGTSMACPHVSGIAALIVSKYGGAQFTATELRQRLLTGIKGMNYNDYVSPQYFDGMGDGYADALAALTDYDHYITPSAPEFVKDKCTSGYGEATVVWKSDNKGSDGSLQKYILYYSTNPITQSNYASAYQHSIGANYAAAGEEFVRTNKRLNSNTTYYFAVRAVARNGHESPLAILNGGITTLYNTAPVIKANIEGNRVTLAGNDTKDIHFTITDKENHKCTFSVTGGGSVTNTITDNGFVMHIEASKFIAGIYPVTITVKDEYGATTTFYLTIEIHADKAPTLKSGTPNINVRQGGETSIPLAGLIDDEDVDKLACLVESATGVDVSVANGTLHIKGIKWGQGQIKLQVTDKHKQTSEITLPVFVYNNTGIYALYPNPVSTTLYLKIGEGISGKVDLHIRNAAGRQILSSTFDTSTLNAQKRTYMIDVTKLPAGRYTLSIKNQDKTYSEAFVKE